MVDLGILILRIVVGIVMIGHSLPKLFWKRRILDKKWRKEYGFPLGSVLLTGFIQLGGGLAIVVGVFTQIAALILTLNMLVATYVTIWKQRASFLSSPEGKGWDINFLLVGVLIVLMFLGEGKWSLVAWLT